MGAEGKEFEWPKISMACCEIRCHPKLIRIADFLNIFLGLFLKYGSYLGWIPVIYYYNQRPIILPGSSLLSENFQAAKIFSESILEPKDDSLNFKAIGESLDSEISNLKPTEAQVQELAFETKFFKHHREKAPKKSPPAQNPVLNLKPFVAPKPVLGDDVLRTAAWEKPAAPEKPEEKRLPQKNDWIFNPAPSEEPEATEKPAPSPAQNLAANPPQAPVAPVNPAPPQNPTSKTPGSKPSRPQKVPKPPHPEVQVQPKPPCIRVEDKANCAKNGNDGTDGELELANHLAAKRAEKPGKFFLLKHHHWMNFTDVGMDQPTYINVIRHPMGRFNSVYYFQRYGFEKMGTDERQGARHTWKGSEEDFEQTLDQCVQRKSDECFERGGPL
ncbi:Oidioi.mRNA.OKI2018_I69.chr1.g1026.t1.cds [Oikopleura dioica]|uniref:Oidioi.mRNA.OKI2018_I69.chr1.g1026.t1.cds n=1 Tax=Oikopleura dioica TaxID=34765 RepID=A0ABN7SLN5_OIKDI|nr:Oidioi.mRNA.OKI2018_I69.chr1.g1026.t1.cds [Oikopleura dioica]